MGLRVTDSAWNPVEQARETYVGGRHRLALLVWEIGATEGRVPVGGGGVAYTRRLSVVGYRSSVFNGQVVELWKRLLFAL